MIGSDQNSALFGEIFSSGYFYSVNERKSKLEKTPSNKIHQIFQNFHNYSFEIKSQKFGKEISTHSELFIIVSPSAHNPAIAIDMAMRWSS